MATDRVTVQFDVRYEPPVFHRPDPAFALLDALADVRSYVEAASDRLRAQLGLPLRYPQTVRVYVWDEEVTRSGRRFRSWRDEMRESTVIELPRSAVLRVLEGLG